MVPSGTAAMISEKIDKNVYSQHRRVTLSIRRSHRVEFCSASQQQQEVGNKFFGELCKLYLTGQIVEALDSFWYLFQIAHFGEDTKRYFSRFEFG